MYIAMQIVNTLLHNKAGIILRSIICVALPLVCVALRWSLRAASLRLACSPVALACQAVALVGWPCLGASWCVLCVVVLGGCGSFAVLALVGLGFPESASLCSSVPQVV